MTLTPSHRGNGITLFFPLPFSDPLLYDIQETSNPLTSSRVAQIPDCFDTCLGKKKIGHRIKIYQNIRKIPGISGRFGCHTLLPSRREEEKVASSFLLPPTTSTISRPFFLPIGFFFHLPLSASANSRHSSPSSLPRKRKILFFHPGTYDTHTPSPHRARRSYYQVFSAYFRW